MTILDERAALLPFTHLAKGNHRDPNAGVCLLEAVAYVAGEKHSDHPECASPILGVFGRNLNDVLPDDKRQRLVPLIPQIVGTAGDGLDQQRGLMAADWLIRVYTPAWLRLGGLGEVADELEALVPRTSWDDVEAVAPLLESARSKAYEKRDAAWDAAWVAARVAAWVAARDAAWVAAWVAARDAAWDAARVAAWVAARAAARDAARAALKPTTDELQDSAIDLYERMVRLS